MYLKSLRSTRFGVSELFHCAVFCWSSLSPFYRMNTLQKMYCFCKVTSVVSDSVWPHRRQPTRFPCSWDSPGKNTGVDCHFLLQCMKVKSESERVAQLGPTLSNPMDCSLPGSSVHGIFPARVLEWGAIAFSVTSFYNYTKLFLRLKTSQSVRQAISCALHTHTFHFLCKIWREVGEICKLWEVC